MVLVCRPFRPLGDCNYSSMGDAHGYWISPLQALGECNYSSMGDAHGYCMLALQALGDCVLEFTTNCRAPALLQKYYNAIN